MAVVTDTIADMLTRIRNANQMRYEEVEVPASKMKEEKNFVLKGNDGLISDATECHKLFIDGENRYIH